ncbi:hypothetical protein P3L10_029168 [Capsicum annuum]
MNSPDNETLIDSKMYVCFQWNANQRSTTYAARSPEAYSQATRDSAKITTEDRRTRKTTDQNV